MGFTAFPSPDTAGSGLARRFGVGEVADFSGVPQAYQATDSFWMQSNTWLARGLIPAAARSLLASAVLSALVAIANPVRDALASNAGNLSASVPPATLPGIAVFQTYTPGAVLLVDSDGPRVVSTGLTGNVAVISDGTALWAYNSGAVLNAATGVAKSLDGKNWTAQAITGWPGTYQVRPKLYPFTTNAGLATSTAQGYKSMPWDTANQSGFFWAGARYIAIVDDGTNLYCCRSTNSLAWTDDTAQVLGASVAVAGANIYFWRNGNTAFLKVGGTYRYTTDGGLNWSAVATPPTALAGGFLQRNASDPARLVASLDYTSLFVSTNSGQTWTNRYAASGMADFGGGIACLGSTIVALSASGDRLRKSNDDGATWSAVALPAAALGRAVRVVADAYRIYIVTAQGTVVTTTDAITFLVRSAYFPASISAVAAISSTVSMFVEEFVGGSGRAVFTIDGGITYASAQMRSGIYGGSVGHSTVQGVTVGGVSYFLGGTENVNANQRDFVVDVADLLAGGALFRASAETIPSQRTNMAAFVRVA